MIFSIILLIFFLLIFGSLWPMFTLIIGGVIILFIVLLWVSQKSSNYGTYADVSYDRMFEHDDSSSSSSDPDRIGAAVSSQLYNEIKNYCGKHHITISDLIRWSVREYMDNHR